MKVLRSTIGQINLIGITEQDTRQQKAIKNLLVYLALFMSMGGVVWGSLLLYLNLPVASLVPYGYIVLSAINILFFYRTKNFPISRSVQIAISMLLPFILQWMLGGFFVSGCVMLWSILSLIASIVLLHRLWALPCLLLYLLLVAISFWHDPWFAANKPDILTPDISLSLLALNMVLVTSIFFVLTKIKIDQDLEIYSELEHVHQLREKNLAAELNARNQLQITENRYRNLVEESRVLICSHNLQGILLTVNKPGAEIIGYTPEELIGKNLRDFLPPEFHGDYDFYLEHIARNKDFESFMTVLTRQGQKRIFLFRNTLITEEGTEPYILGSAQDVTEWRKTEFREKKIRSELQLIISSMDDFVVEFDEEARFKNLWCRDESRLFMPVSSFIGKTIAEAFSHAPEFAVRAQELYDEALNTGEVRSIEIEDIFSKSPLFYLARLNPMKEKDGKCIRCTAVVTNITDGKQAEAKLNEAFQTQNVLIENLEGAVLKRKKAEDSLAINEITLKRAQKIGNLGSWMLDINKPFLEWSDECYGIFGIPQGTPVTYGIFLTTIYADDRNLVNEAWFNAMKGGVFSMEYRIIVNGNIKWIQASAELEYDTSGKFQRALGIVKDISEFKLYEESLRIAKEDAEKASYLKTIFLGNLSHEVRTPLQGIQGFAEILERTDIPEVKRTEYLNIIKQRTIDLQNIIDSLLDMASLETGEIKSFPVLMNLTEFIEENFLSLQQDHSLKGKSLELVLENSIPAKSYVQIDPLHLKQVINNLVKNGIKFTNNGFVKLAVIEGKENFFIDISDSGIGIEPGRLDFIFEPFRQAHEGLSRSKGGIGLGLSICKKMISLWGGSIHVTSTPGKGSIFSFSIPKK